MGCNISTSQTNQSVLPSVEVVQDRLPGKSLAACTAEEIDAWYNTLPADLQAYRYNLLPQEGCFLVASWNPEYLWRRGVAADDIVRLLRYRDAATGAAERPSPSLRSNMQPHQLFESNHGAAGANGFAAGPNLPGQIPESSAIATGDNMLSDRTTIPQDGLPGFTPAITISGGGRRGDGGLYRPAGAEDTLQKSPNPEATAGPNAVPEPRVGSQGATRAPSTQPAPASELDQSNAMARPARHISRAAVSLAFLQQFMDDHRIRQRELTTKQVADEIIIPPTAAARCRYTDLMLGNPEHEGAVSQGRPFFFISHAWKCKFADTYDMVARHFTPEQQRLWRHQDGQPLAPLRPEEVFVWLDTFAVNQNEELGADGSDLQAVWEAVRDAYQTLMVLDAEGALLTRIWCLYEAWHSGRAGQGKLRLLSYGIPWKPLQKVFLDLDVRRGQATVQADRDRILEDIRRDVGSLDTMTHALKDALVGGAMVQVPPEDAVWDDGVAGRVYAAAMLCQMYGRLPQAESLSQRALEGSERSLGPDHLETLTALSNLAGVLELQGKYSEAEPLCRRALESSERVLGPDHPDTLAAVNNLAGLLTSQGKYEEAGPLCQRALAVREQVLGPTHSDTLTSVSNLAGLQKSCGKYDRAEALYRRALDGRQVGLGPDHPDTLTTATNLAGVLKSQGRYAEAKALYQQALKGLERVLGPDHPDTLTSVSNLAGLLCQQGAYGEAEELFRKSLAGSERVLGRDHPDTLRILNNLASLLDQQGRYAEAEPLFWRALEGVKATMGSDHPATFYVISNLAGLLKSQGKYAEAEPLDRQALEGLERTAGPDHPDTLTAVNNLAGSLKSQGKYDEAERLFRRALESSTRALGPGHYCTRIFARNLADLARSQGVPDKAIV